MLPLWRTPHTFGLVPVEGDERPLPPMAAVTVGPLVADLAALAHPTPETVIRLGRALGFEWLASLVVIDRPRGVDEPELATFLHKRYALRPGVSPNPFGIRAGKLARQQARSIPTQVISQFVGSEAGRLGYVGKTLQSLAAPLLASAKGDPKPGVREQQRASELLNALEEPIRVQRFYTTRTERPIYWLAPRNLYVRALLELIELYDDTPPLGVCARCTRLFVRQRNNDKYCQRYIWPAFGREYIAGCIYDHNPTPTRVRQASEVRRREYKKLQMRAIRTANDLGPQHAIARRAKAAFEQWKNENQVTLGRPPTPVPLDQLLDPTRSEAARSVAGCLATPARRELPVRPAARCHAVRQLAAARAVHRRHAELS
jgi:hypothetical protein